MYPVTLIRISKRRLISIETKTNDTYMGTLIICDLYMNIRLRDVAFISSDGTKNLFFKECLIRGGLVKKIKLTDNLLDVQNIVEKKKKIEQ